MLGTGYDRLTSGEMLGAAPERCLICAVPILHRIRECALCARSWSRELQKELALRGGVRPAPVNEEPEK